MQLAVQFAYVVQAGSGGGTAGRSLAYARLFAFSKGCLVATARKAFVFRAKPNEPIAKPLDRNALLQP
jgi:hypothetical protein